MRKRWLAAGATLTASAVLATTAPAAAPVAPTAPCTGGYMQVVAHEDDDLIFMNPDVDSTVAAGAASVTVYVTAGEPGAVAPEVPRVRARDRQRGVQNAYAAMAGVADGDDQTQHEWDRAAIAVGDGRLVERYRLRARPCVALVFMNLPDAGLPFLDESPARTVSTVVPADGVAPGSYTYRRVDVVSALGALLSRHLPTVLRYQDDAPDPRYAPDHPDHVAAAGFARDAAAGFAGPLYTVPYRGYGVRDLTANLDPAAVARKTSILMKYARFDGRVLRSPGDLRTDYRLWMARSYHRWPRGTQWAARNADGTAQAFAVRNGRIFTYRQAAGGGWAAPGELAGPGGRVVEGVTVIPDADGRLALFVRRVDHRILVWRQERAGGVTGSWTDLGNPNAGTANQAQVGSPAGAVRGRDGRLEVFVRNGDGGVSTRFEQRGGGWDPSWHDLRGGPDVQDGLCAVPGLTGDVEVFAATLTGIARWYQEGPGNPLVRDMSFPATAAASPPGCALTRAGTIDVVYRLEATGTMAVSWQESPGGAWGPAPREIAAVLGGVGQPATVTTGPVSSPDRRVVLFARDGSGGVSTSRQAAANTGYGPWAQTGSGLVVDFAAAAVGVGDRVVVFAVRAGGVYAAAQASPGAAAGFGPWRLVG